MILEHVILCVVLLLQVPLVPIVPALSVFINLYLMLVLDVYTWIRFGVWLAIGKPVGFEFFIVVDLKTSILWYIVPCRSLKMSQAKQRAIMNQVYFMPVSCHVVGLFLGFSSDSQDGGEMFF